MTAPRIQVPGLQAPPGLTTPARPNDPFVQPQRGNDTASQLARALASLSPSLARFGQTVGQKDRDPEKRAGAELARETLRDLDENRLVFAEEVRAGRIAPVDNPFMRQGYSEELGRLFAGRFQSELMAALDSEDSLKESVDMSDFRSFAAKFEEDFKARNLPENESKNPAFITGFGNRRDAIIDNAAAGFAAQINERLTTRTMTMFRDEASNFLDTALDDERDPTEIAGFLRQLWDDKVAIGWPGGAIGQSLIDAVTDVAISRRDPNLTQEILSKINGGPAGQSGGSLDKTSRGREAIRQARRDIFDALDTDDKTERLAQRQADDDIEREALSRLEAAEANGTPPGEIDINDLQALAIKNGSPATVGKLQTIVESYKNDEYSDDNTVKAQLLRKLHANPLSLTRGEIFTAFKNKNLSFATFDRLNKDLDAALASLRSGGTSLQDDDGFKFALKKTLGYFTPLEGTDRPVVAHTQRQAETAITDWYYENFFKPGAPLAGLTQEQRRKAVEEQALAISRVWNVADTDGEFFDEGEVLRLQTSSLDWTVSPIRVPRRLEIIEELERWVRDPSETPSRGLIGTLQMHGVNFGNRAEIERFLKIQKTLVPLDR